MNDYEIKFMHKLIAENAELKARNEKLENLLDRIADVCYDEDTDAYNSFEATLNILGEY